MEVLLKNATTNKCPTCGNETEIEFAKFKGLKPTSLAIQLLEEMINEMVQEDLNLIKKNNSG